MRNFSFFLFLFILFSACTQDDNSSSQEGKVELASVVIYPVEDILGDMATGGGEITNAGNSEITQKGLVWSINTAPDMSDFRSSEGTGTDGFLSQMPDLQFNTIYYVRAYAINAAGISYSNEINFITTNECTLNVFDGSITLTTQSEINAFGLNNYCKITGDLYIIQPETAVTDLINDLTPLSNLRYIRRLRVEGTTVLQSLAGLDNVSEIFDTINVDRNEGIMDIDGLMAVNGELTGISLAGNDLLANIDGLSNITGLIPPSGYSNPSFIYIQESPILQNINGLQNLQSLQSDSEITLSELPLVTNLTPLQGISGEMGRLQLVFLPALENLDPLINITRINSGLDIFQCDGLDDLGGLANLRSIQSDFFIGFNDLLISLEGLSNLESVGGNLTIRENGVIDFCDIQNLLGANGVSGVVTIENNVYNPSVQDIIDGNCSI
jgi:hypothetical protein